MTVQELGAEFHEFSGGGRRFLYTVPSAGIFELDDVSAAVLSRLSQGEATQEELIAIADVETIGELYQSRIISASTQAFVDQPQPLPDEFPLQTMVMNLTNQCNLSCQYCYEFGEDKVATPEGKPKFMDFETASASVDYLFTQSAGRHGVHITFFGGETLMNFPLLKKVVDYAKQKAADQGRSIDFSLTTNATLLTPTIIEYLSANEIGVTVSMDGDKASHDKFRVFSNGKGSYDIVEPRVRELIKEHKTRPIVARVTMTSQAMDVLGTYRHLKNDLGFHEIGFAPVTTSPNRLYSIDNQGLSTRCSRSSVSSRRSIWPTHCAASITDSRT